MSTKKEQVPPRGFVAEWAVTFILLLFGTTTLAQAFVIPSGSMEETLLVGDHLLVDKLAYAPADAVTSYLLPYSDVKRGDIIVFNPPGQHSEPYIKRIIGLPGDRISVHDGAVYINDQRLEENYLTSDTEWQGIATKDVQVNPGYIFGMGDNRNNSSDSRVFGQVPISSVIGKAWVAYWPMSQVKLVSDPSYSLAH